MSPIAGFTRFRQWAFSAAQSAHGTASTPSAAFPWRGVLDVNPNWDDVDDEIDNGSVDPLASPFRTHLDSSAQLTGPLDYNSIPLIMSAGVRGGVSPTGSGPYTWAHQALSLTATTLDEFSTQWGDDFGADDYRLKDGVIEEIEFSFDESLGPWQVSTRWYWGAADPHVTKVAGLVLPSNLPLVFGADTALYIDDTAGGIGSTQISDALHSARIRIRNTIDRKRFANGSNSRFALAGYGFSAREIEAEFTFAKTTAIAGFSGSEMRDWLNADPVNRYVKVLATSREIAGGSTAFSWDQRLPLTWRTRSDGELGGNTTITLMGRGRYDATLGYAYRSSVVNSNSALP